MEKIITNNEEATFRLGKKLGRHCLGNETFLLIGNLGAGKTRFLQGLAAGLGVKSQVNSPTFNIMKVYSGLDNEHVKAFCHIDAYRLSSGADLLALGVDEYLSSNDTVTAIEWAEKVEDIWPRKFFKIVIKNLDENTRELVIKKKI